MTGAPEAIVEQSMSDRGYEVRNLSFGPPCGLPRFLSRLRCDLARLFSRLRFRWMGRRIPALPLLRGLPLPDCASTPLRPLAGVLERGRVVVCREIVVERPCRPSSTSSRRCTTRGKPWQRRCVHRECCALSTRILVYLPDMIVFSFTPDRSGSDTLCRHGFRNAWNLRF